MMRLSNSKSPVIFASPATSRFSPIKTFLPIKIHEKISEGNFKRSTTVHFNRTNNFALINNDTLQIEKSTQSMSAFRRI